MTDWLRVSKDHPCSVCGKPDWCTVAGDASCCMRVQSDRPMANGGWLHGEAKPIAPTVHTPRRPRYEAPAFDAHLWWRAARHVARMRKLSAWACSLGLPPTTVDFMGGCTVGGMLCFPMHDGTGNICGIRTRDHNGAKKAVTGSKAGVFLSTAPLDLDVLICEGPTDAAAAMALGFEPIGRPSCAGCEHHVVDTCRRMDYGKVTICADADGPGITGARKLADVLRAARIGVRLVTPGGHKDLRDWWRAGARREAVDAAWSQAGWR